MTAGRSTALKGLHNTLRKALLLHASTIDIQLSSSLRTAACVHASNQHVRQSSVCCYIAQSLRAMSARHNRIAATTHVIGGPCHHMPRLDDVPGLEDGL